MTSGTNLTQPTIQTVKQQEDWCCWKIYSVDPWNFPPSKENSTVKREGSTVKKEECIMKNKDSKAKKKDGRYRKWIKGKEREW